jgi:hypothetical protein
MPNPMQFTDFGSVDSGCDRSAQLLTVLPGMRQPSPRSLPQNLSFELSKNREQSSHGVKGCSAQGRIPRSRAGSAAICAGRLNTT